MQTEFHSLQRTALVLSRACISEPSFLLEFHSTVVGIHCFIIHISNKRSQIIKLESYYQVIHLPIGNSLFNIPPLLLLISTMSRNVLSNTIVILAAFILVLGEGIVPFVSSQTNTRVAAGGNGSSWDTFFPQRIQIGAGETVTWYNPSPVAEPHTTTLLTNSSYLPPLAAPFDIPNDTRIVSKNPNPNVEPIILSPISSVNTDGNKTVIMDNARAYLPVVIDSTGIKATYLELNGNYTMSGTETYVNSGVMWPEGQTPPGAPPIEEFTVTFETPGTYSYTCLIHPWMTGQVDVS
jgi:plastocyanin